MVESVAGMTSSLTVYDEIEGFGRAHYFEIVIHRFLPGGVPHFTIFRALSLNDAPDPHIFTCLNKHCQIEDILQFLPSGKGAVKYEDPLRFSRNHPGRQTLERVPIKRMPAGWLACLEGLYDFSSDPSPVNHVVNLILCTLGGPERISATDEKVVTENVNHVNPFRDVLGDRRLTHATGAIQGHDHYTDAFGFEFLDPFHNSISGSIHVCVSGSK